MNREIVCSEIMVYVNNKNGKIGQFLFHYFDDIVKWRPSIYDGKKYHTECPFSEELKNWTFIGYI